MSNRSLIERAKRREARDLVRDLAAWPGPDADSAIDSEALAGSVMQHFTHTLGREIDQASAHYLYLAVAMTVRDRLMDRWRSSRHITEQAVTRRTCYLSLEYLMGRSLGNAVLNMEIEDELREALHTIGLALEDIESLESDAGLGNGGLGRLAACFLDSCATLGLPVTGYGLRYRFGMFRQRISDGYQIEEPDAWLNRGHAWELERPDRTVRVTFGGHVKVLEGRDGRLQHHWVDTDDVLAIAHDVPIPGYGNGVVNTLRLWSAAATEDFNLNEFNAGGYTEAVAAKNAAENITMVLYPNDRSENGKVLRLRQQYFLVSASLQDVLRTWQRHHTGFGAFAAAHCFQLNDTHPSLAVAELMRLLVDEHHLEWDAAWEITTATMAYTNHTLLPEALESWSLDMIRGLLPRPMAIIEEINRRFLIEVQQRWPGDAGKRAAMSIISFDPHPVVRMANLAIVGSFSINGVAELHSKLLKQGLFSNFNALWPERFNNKTNGVTQRRWLAHCNPGLAELLNETVGPGWVTDLEHVSALVPMAGDPALQQRWRAIKLANKERLNSLVLERTGVKLDPTMLYDVQVKRIHEYKRQLLCALHAVHAYLELQQGRGTASPRAILIAGKAAPGYDMAKWIIKLINSVAAVINHDPATRDHLKLLFIPDYNVSAMERIAPACDLSEQISTAGKEASGTGNMKFMMNGALTIGTLDGANIEILDAVGEENFFRFGMNVQEVEQSRRDYQPDRIIASDSRVRAIVEAFRSGLFDGDDPGLIQRVIDAAINPFDPWMTIADLPSYLDAQHAVSAAWQDAARWTHMSILNTAHSGRFSTDRTMREYNRDIWRLEPLKQSNTNAKLRRA